MVVHRLVAGSSAPQIRASQWCTQQPAAQSGERDSPCHTPTAHPIAPCLIQHMPRTGQGSDKSVESECACNRGARGGRHADTGCWLAPAHTAGTQSGVVAHTGKLPQFGGALASILVACAIDHHSAYGVLLTAVQHLAAACPHRHPNVGSARPATELAGIVSARALTLP